MKKSLLSILILLTLGFLSCSEIGVDMEDPGLTTEEATRSIGPESLTPTASEGGVYTVQVVNNLPPMYVNLGFDFVPNSGNSFYAYIQTNTPVASAVQLEFEMWAVDTYGNYHHFTLNPVIDGGKRISVKDYQQIDGTIAKLVIDRTHFYLSPEYDASYRYIYSGPTGGYYPEEWYGN